MARKVITQVTCDNCGREDSDLTVVTITIDGETRVIDLCNECLAPVRAAFDAASATPPADGSSKPKRDDHHRVEAFDWTPPAP